MQMAAQRTGKRRRYMPFWRLPEIPLCPTCAIPCIANGTNAKSGNLAIQFRRCPVCGKGVKTCYKIEPAAPQHPTLFTDEELGGNSN